VSAEAIRNFVLRFGTGKSERKIDIGMLLSENRKIIDRTSKRLFFVKEPVRLEIGSMTEEQKMVKLRLHPTEDLGYKEYTLSNIFYISGEDANAIENSSVVLLKDLYRVRITKAGNVIKGEIVNSSENVPVIQWVNEGNYAQGTIKQIEPLLKNNELNPDSMKDVPGYIEKYVDKLKDGETVNLERMGFYKLDSKQERIFFSL
jgi:glutamyl/glutaminyl-tRNA synthetase